MSTPQSTIYVCSGVRLNPRYEHSIYFARPEEQENYFAGKVVHTFPAYSYLRKTWSLQVQATMVQAKTWSYLYFYNVDGGKRYYYFITQIEYKNENTVELTLELDVLQTYLFDFKLLECFIERQHTETDLIGEHTVEENLETGELVSLSNKDIDMGSLAIIMLTSALPVDQENETVLAKVNGYLYDGVYSGLAFYAVQASDWGKLDAMMFTINTEPILTLYMYPEKLLKYAGDGIGSGLGGFTAVSGSNSFFENFERPQTLDNGYTPKNKKLLTYPYNVLYLTNNNGESATYRYEKFGDPYYCNFKVVGVVSPDAQARIYPLNYAGEQHAYEHGLTLSGFPICAWNQDVYKLWLAQNQNQLNYAGVTAGATALAGTAMTVAGIATGNMVLAGAGATTAYSGASQIASLIAQKEDMEAQPPQARGKSSISVNTAAKFQTFTIKKKCIDEMHAKIIDNYFTMYGYRLNRLGVPNMKARPSFTYVKTVGCHITRDKRKDPRYGESDICTEDALKIESIFNQGVTFWVDGDRICDYTQDNTV